MHKSVSVWKRLGEEWTPSCMHPGHGARMSLMILGCITDEGMGTITVVDGNISSANYIDVIGCN